MMPKNTERALIESDAFGNLVPEIDKKAAKEKGPGEAGLLGNDFLVD